MECHNFEKCSDYFELTVTAFQNSILINFHFFLNKKKAEMQQFRLQMSETGLHEFNICPSVLLIYTYACHSSSHFPGLVNHTMGPKLIYTHTDL